MDAQIAERFLQPGTAANYDRMARDIARVEDCSTKEAMAKLVAGWKVQDERYPSGGYDVLVAWGEGRDPGDGLDGTQAAYDLQRAVHSAQADPGLALQGSDEAVSAAKDELDRRADAEASRPEGTLPNTGPAQISQEAAEGSNDAAAKPRRRRAAKKSTGSAS